MHGALRIRIFVTTDKDDRRERGRMVVVRTIYCEQDEAREEFRKFCELNPHLADGRISAEYTYREHIH